MSFCTTGRRLRAEAHDELGERRLPLRSQPQKILNTHRIKAPRQTRQVRTRLQCVPQSKSPRLGDVTSPASRGDEMKLDPKALSLINAACAQMQARSIRLRFSFSFVVLEDPRMASLAYCRNRSASLMTASRLETPRRRLPSCEPW